MHLSTGERMEKEEVLANICETTFICTWHEMMKSKHQKWLLEQKRDGGDDKDSPYSYNVPDPYEV